MWMSARVMVVWQSMIRSGKFVKMVQKSIVLECRYKVKCGDLWYCVAVLF